MHYTSRTFAKHRVLKSIEVKQQKYCLIIQERKEALEKNVLIPSNQLTKYSNFLNIFDSAHFTFSSGFGKICA